MDANCIQVTWKSPSPSATTHCPSPSRAVIVLDQRLRRPSPGRRRQETRPDIGAIRPADVDERIPQSYDLAGAGDGKPGRKGVAELCSTTAYRSLAPRAGLVTRPGWQGRPHTSQLNMIFSPSQCSPRPLIEPHPIIDPNVCATHRASPLAGSYPLRPPRSHLRRCLHT